VDCSALPDHLFENELFGHARGAYTDAHGDQKGLAELADKGTLFLDEIDSLSISAQAKLLRFLQEQTYKPLGAERFVRVNVRVIIATNCVLERLLIEQRFRRDLYFRLNVLRLQLPPLRERRNDVGLLASHFLKLTALPDRRSRKSFSAAALRKMASYHWPGNIRELFNVVQRAAICCKGPQILPRDIFLAEGSEHRQVVTRGPDRRCTYVPILAGDSKAPSRTLQQARAEAIGQVERSFIVALLRKHQGNITRAAQEAGKDRRAFGRLVKKYRINRLDV
jgi:transcriptional regulator with GAF, ATPase, and Fis domain